MQIPLPDWYNTAAAYFLAPPTPALALCTTAGRVGTCSPTPEMGMPPEFIELTNNKIKRINTNF